MKATHRAALAVAAVAVAALALAVLMRPEAAERRLVSFAETKPKKDPPKKKKVDGKWKCKKGWTLINGVCRSCQGGNFVKGKCVRCGAGQRLHKGKCVGPCKAGQRLHKGKCVGPCKPTQRLIDGKCVGGFKKRTGGEERRDRDRKDRKDRDRKDKDKDTDRKDKDTGNQEDERTRQGTEPGTNRCKGGTIVGGECVCPSGKRVVDGTCINCAKGKCKRPDIPATGSCINGTRKNEKGECVAEDGKPRDRICNPFSHVLDKKTGKCRRVRPSFGTEATDRPRESTEPEGVQTGTLAGAPLDVYKDPGGRQLDIPCREKKPGFGYVQDKQTNKWKCKHLGQTSTPRVTEYASGYVICLGGSVWDTKKKKCGTPLEVWGPTRPMRNDVDQAVCRGGRVLVNGKCVLPKTTNPPTPTKPTTQKTLPFGTQPFGTCNPGKYFHAAYINPVKCYDTICPPGYKSDGKQCIG